MADCPAVASQGVPLYAPLMTWVTGVRGDRIFDRGAWGSGGSGTAFLGLKWPKDVVPKPSAPSNELATILVIDRDEVTIEGLKAMLGDRYRLAVASTGRDAMAMLADLEPSLMLLDVALPDLAGLDLCRSIRSRTAAPIIVVSANGSEAEAVASFQAGADGYVTKPYRWRELVARIGVALRRSPPRPARRERVLSVGDVTLDIGRHEVRVRGSVIEFPLREFELLEVFLSGVGKVFTREALMLRIWGETPPSGTKSVDVHIKRIRARIEDDPSLPTRIITVRGLGYAYAAPVTDLKQ